jgi:hypothetical protein
LTSALVGGEWSASRPGRFTPENEPPVPVVIGSLEMVKVEKVKIYLLQAMEVHRVV